MTSAALPQAEGVCTQAPFSDSEEACCSLWDRFTGSPGPALSLHSSFHTEVTAWLQRRLDTVNSPLHR